MKALKGSSKHGVFQVFSFFGFCILMCGTFAGILVSSGWLLLFTNEGQSKVFLIPLLILLAVTYFGYKRTECDHKISHAILYILMSLVVSALVMLYIFIPWWLPSYEGGPLLP